MQRHIWTYTISLAFLCSACSGQAATAPSPQRGTVSTSDVDLRTFIYGAPSAQTPIIVVNGGPGLSHVYLIQNDVWTHRLAAHRQVILYDQRGTGESRLKRPDAPQSLDAQVADLEAVRAALRVEQVNLAGDSYGGILASAYAAAHPQHVRSLILSDSAAPGFASLHPRLEEFYPDVVAATKAKVAQLTGPAKQAKAADLQLRAHFRMIFYSAELCERYLKQAQDLGSTPAVGAAVSQAIEHLDLLPQMARFAFPVLILQGRFDVNVTPDVAWQVKQRIAGSRLVWFEHSGHLPYYEEPDRYVSVVNAFLQMP